MSLNTRFSNYEDVIEFLKNHDYPQCFTVNYRPNEDDYELWIGNQPYTNYEKWIEEVEESLHIARVGRRDLTSYVKQLKEEVEELIKYNKELAKANENYKEVLSRCRCEECGNELGDATEFSYGILCKDCMPVELDY